MINHNYVMNPHAAEADKVIHGRRWHPEEAVARKRSASADGLRNAILGRVSGVVLTALADLENLADPLLGDAQLEPSALSEIGHHLERAVELCRKARGQ